MKDEYIINGIRYITINDSGGSCTGCAFNDVSDFNQFDHKPCSGGSSEYLVSCADNDFIYKLAPKGKKKKLIIQ